MDPKTKNLFAETTMTFGEHLEELRTCLFRALTGLAIGFVIGLTCAHWVVQFIQSPLEEALTTFRQEQTVDRLVQLQKDGALPPGDLARYGELVNDDHLLAKEYFVDPAELRRCLDGESAEKESAEKPTGNSEKPSSGIPDPPDAESESTAPDTTEPASKEDVGAKIIPIRKTDLVSVTLWHPVADEVRVTSLNAHEAFVIWIKAGLLVGVLLASPYIFYQIWAFVAAGLYPHEKRYIHIFLPFSIALFLAGAALAFFFVFEPVLQFLLTFNKALGIDPDLRISEWLGFVLVLPLGFGVSFQLPLVMLFLERIGIFDIHAYLTKWRIAILVIFVMAMFLTPADPTSMLLMAAPLTILYFGGILLCKFLPRSRSPYDEWDDEDEEE